MCSAREHWNKVYSTKDETEVSWYQSIPTRSLALIKSLAPSPLAPILDVGGGASHLVDELLVLGYSDLTVLDVSETALTHTRARLGSGGAKVTWITADITQWQPSRHWTVWHDRAVFHFLTDVKDQAAYIAALEAATRPGSLAIISTFALNGPERCSGLLVQRYSPASLAARIGSNFQLVSQANEAHTTPGGNVQQFTYAVLKRQ